MKSTYLLPALVIAILSFSSCTKKNDTGDTSKTKSELIVSSSWKFSKATVSGINVSSFLQDCQKDNIATFQSNGNGILDEGATKCNAGDPQATPFTWNFASSESILHVSTVLFTGGSNDFTLVSLSSTELVVSQVISVSGSSQTAVLTFVH